MRKKKRTGSATTRDDTRTDDVDLVYGQSLAMVSFLLDRSGEGALKEALEGLRAAPRKEARSAARGLWNHLYPGVGQRELLEALGRRMFRVPPGAAFDGVLEGAICCYGTTRLGEFGCRVAPMDATRSRWLDESKTPSATCYRD